MRTVTLAIEGMTCASCVARVEKKLSKLDGVEASVNLATEQATITLPEGMDPLDCIATVEKAGYGAQLIDTSHADAGALDDSRDEDSAAHRQMLRTRAIICVLLSVPVMALSMVPALQVTGWQWIVAALALPVALWGAWPFHTAALRALRHGTSTMDTLVSLGVLAATAWSLWALLWGGAGHLGMRMSMEFLPRAQSAHPHLYFESAAWVTTFLLIGRYAEARARHRSSDALRALLRMGAQEATRVTLQDPADLHSARQTARVSVDVLRVGDLLAVAAGEKIPTDGEVLTGAGSVDTSMVTGESVPREVGAGDSVIGGTILSSGTLLMRATAVGEGTTLAQIGALVTAAQAGKAPVQRLADRVSAVFVPTVIVIAALTCAGWLLTGHSAQAALTTAVAVLVIACPCALGLATPTAILVGSGRAAQSGILFTRPDVVETTHSLDTVVLDKTGTITTGTMRAEAEEITLSEDSPFSREEVIAMVASVESVSDHPIAHALAGLVEQPLTPQDVNTDHGLGVRGNVQGHEVSVGRPQWGADRQDAVTTGAQPLPAELDSACQQIYASGGTAVLVRVDGQPVAVAAVRDTVRPQARQAIARLREAGIRPIILTGDHQRTAQAIAAQVGVPAQDVIADVMPADKQAQVEALQQQGHRVGMVGDGVNDAAALAQAGVRGVGMAMGSGTDAAIAAADITIMRQELTAVADAVQLSRSTVRIIKQNLFWAFAYNVAAIPLAVAGLLNPMIAGAAMACSSVIVVSNSLRLRRA